MILRHMAQSIWGKITVSSIRGSFQCITAEPNTCLFSLSMQDVDAALINPFLKLERWQKRLNDSLKTTASIKQCSSACTCHRYPGTPVI